MVKLRILVVLIASWLGSFLVLDTLWKHPSEILLREYTDAIKNYYVPIWYVLHDSSAHFSGMQYPYGDNYVFGDVQPALAETLRWYHVHVQPLSAYEVVAAINLALAIGFSLCYLCVYLLLREVNLPWLYSLLLAFLITYLSPQLMRLTGHYGLAYAFAVPAVWLLCHYVLNKKWPVLWFVLLYLLQVLLIFLHVYYAVICGVFVLAIASFSLLYRYRVWRTALPRFGLAVASVALAFVTFQLWIAINSTVTDRVKVPYGFEAALANFQSIFLPSYMPLWFDSKVEYEGMAYTGTIGFLVLAFWIYKFGGYIVKRKVQLIIHPVLPEPLRAAFWPSIVIMFLSMGVPLMWIKDWLPDSLMQFRSLGRLAWVFYYFITITGAYGLYQAYRYLSIKGLKKLALLLVLFSVGYWFYEMELFVRPLQMRFYDNYKTNSADRFLLGEIPDSIVDAHRLNMGSFQAIIPLPFFSNGSEKLVAIAHNLLEYSTYRTSLQFGMPIVASNMARTSVSQNATIWQLFSNPIIDRAYIDDLNGDNRPFLLMYYSNSSLTEGEDAMLEKASKLFTVGAVDYYSITVEQLKGEEHNYFEDYIAGRDTMQQLGDAFVSEQGFYYSDGFDENKNQLGLQLSGALHAIKDTVWLTKKLDIPANDDTLEISYWLYLDPAYCGLGELWGTLESDMGNIAIYANPADGKDIFKQWKRISVAIGPIKEPATLTLFMTGRYITIDRLLIKPQSATIYQPTNNADTVLYNNYFIYPRLGLKTK